MAKYVLLWFLYVILQIFFERSVPEQGSFLNRSAAALVVILKTYNKSNQTNLLKAKNRLN